VKIKTIFLEMEIYKSTCQVLCYFRHKTKNWPKTEKPW